MNAPKYLSPNIMKTHNHPLKYPVTPCEEIEEKKKRMRAALFQKNTDLPQKYKDWEGYLTSAFCNFSDGREGKTRCSLLTLDQLPGDKEAPLPLHI